MWWITIALAAPPLSHGWNLADRGCYDDVLSLAGEALAEEPNDAGWHRLRDYAVQRKSYQAYRAHKERLQVMAAEYPDHRGLAVARASALLSEREVDCEAVDELLAAPFEDPADQYEVLRLKLSAAGRCEGDADALKAELRGLDVPQATSLALSWDLRDDPKQVSVEALLEQVERYPARADSYAKTLWGEKKGPGALRKALLEASEDWTESDDPYELLSLMGVLEAAGKDVPEGLADRLQEALPCSPTPDAEEAGADRAWRSEVYAADKRPTHEGAVASLLELEKDVPDRPVDRVFWLNKLRSRYQKLGDVDEEYRLSKEIAHLVPEDGNAVNDWAYDASVRGEDLEEALTMLEHAFEVRPDFAYDPADRNDFSEVRRRYLRRTYNWEDTRGWLLHQLGRHEEAAAAYDRALLARQSGVGHAHAGMVHVALGNDDLAFVHLKEAFTLGVSEEALAAEAKAALEPLALAHGAWHPEGYDGWVAMLGKKPDEGEVAPRSSGPETHALIGKAFPIEAAEGLGGGEVAIVGNDAKATVVDVWATWCGPCVAGMPHLQQVATAYAERGVKVVGLSVDEQKGVAKRFYKGTDVAYGLAWYGKGGFADLQITGIPSLFVLDGEGVVTHKITGYGDGDTRLEAALDEVLGGKVE